MSLFEVMSVWGNRITMQKQDRVRPIIPTDAQWQFQDDRPWQTYRRGEYISLRDGGMWQVCRGWVQLSSLSIDGRERILGWLGSSLYLTNGENDRVAYQAKALSDVSLAWYTSGDIETSSDLKVNLVFQLAWRQRQLLELVALLQHKHADERLAHLLMLLKREMGQSVVEGTKLSVRLTHSDLANAIGSCRVYLTRVLAQFRQKNLVSWDADRHLVIHDLALAHFLQGR